MRRRLGFWGGLLHELAGERLRLGAECRVLILLSILDLLLTYALLRHPAGVFYEANPVAQWWFARWNIAGMTAFKFGAIGLAIGIAEVVERRRAGLGRFVVVVGILGVLYAIVTGARLLGGA